MKPALTTSLRGKDKEPQKSREILSFTGAAVRALSTFNINDKPGETSVSSGVRASKYFEQLNSTSTSCTSGSLGQDQRDVLALGANAASSSHSSSRSTTGSLSGYNRADSKIDTSFLDSSFDRSSARRVRIPARLLREIKSPQNGNEVSRGNAQRGIQQQAALVVRHVDGPSAWVSMATPTSSTDDVRMTHTEPTTSTKTVFTHEVSQSRDLIEQENPFQNSISVIQETQSGDKPGNVDGNDDEQVDNASTSVLKKGNGERQSCLYQGDPVTGCFKTNTKHSNSTKAKSFSLSERERVLKEEFLKKKDRKSAPVKRLVQPTVIATKEEQAPTLRPNTASQDAVVSAAAIAAAAASAATAPFLQIQHGLESQISALVSSLNVLHDQQTKLEHHKVVEQEHRLQEQLDARLKKLEEIQKQILESQTSQTSVQPRYPHVSDVPCSHPSALVRSSTSCVSSSATSDPVTTYYGHPNKPLQTTIDNHKPPVPYVPASQHFTQRPAQTQTTSTTKDTLSKFKLVKNARTQTSPQDSSLLSSDSPLQTPLPRKRPPLPMSRDSLIRSHAKELRYSELPREKRVHFDDPALRQSQQYKSFAEIQSHPKHLVMNKPSAHFQTFYPQRENIQEKEKIQQSDTKEVVDDLSRIKKDLKSVMMETEKIRDNLSLQKTKAEIEERFSQVNEGPSPLDAYLSFLETSRPVEKTVIDKLTAAPVVEHYTDAERILRNVQMKRNNLESNLNAIMRQTDEEHMYAAVDSMIQQAQGVETLRIRKDVDRIIKEINMTVKKEIEVECKSAKIHAEPDIAANQDKKLPPKTKYQPGTALSKRQPKKMAGKENVPHPKTTTTKPKPTVKPSSSHMKTSVKPESKPVSKPVTKPVSKPDPPARPQTYLTSVYGRQPYHPQRITSKAPYLHYQSPVNPRTAALTSAILGAGSRVQSKAVHQESSEQIQTRNEPPIQRNEPPRYYFHPDMDMSNVVPSREGRVHLDAPVEGHLVPMAIPLGKPKTDESLRLPLTMGSTSVNDTVRKPSPAPRKKPSPNKPNVAVITIRDKEAGDDSTNLKKKKEKSQTTRRADLGVQILPPMDIDSLTESSDSVLTPRGRHVDHVSDISEPFTRPDDSEYDDFRNYLIVRDTEPEREEKDDDDEVPRIPTPENPLTIEGHTEKECMYHGPPFPPQHPPLPSNTHPGVLDADNRVNIAIEDRAVEWVEQELLARIVSEINQPLPDPTLATRTTPESSPDSSVVTDDGDMLAATIGLGGIQLFVDAGIPVDRDFVAELIKDAIAEQIVSTLGYPKPTATPIQPQEDVQEGRYSSELAETPVSTPLPTPVYTPVESEASEPHSPAVATPGPSPVPSQPSYTTESEDEPTPVKEVSEAREKSESEVLEARSPVPTPVATPSGSHSPTASVSTPEPSTRELESEIGSLLPTPQATERTPSPPPEPSTISTPPVESSVTTPKPPTLTSSPSSMTTSTLSTPATSSTMTTIDEELSEGQLLQPYVHMGQYSEGEYTAAFSPGLERKFPDDGMDVLGKDQDSRNQLIRVALHGLLRRSLGSSSSTTSTVSTLKDTDDIREDSLVDYTHSEGEIVFPRDRVPVSFARPGQTGGPDSTSSEGEIVSAHRSHGTSPGELKPSIESKMSLHSPGEISTRPNVQSSQLDTAANRWVVKEAASPDNTESRSLHTSDLHQKDRKIIGTKRLLSHEEHITRRQEGEEPKVDNQGKMPTSSKVAIDKEIGEPSSRPPPICVPIPPMDDSSLNSEERPGDEQEDTYGDVSSISGGDF